jgi:prevent-host-death family protein
MAKTSTVSVRDLKENVGELVARAGRGERIVVTRYGTPRALLGPVPATPRSSTARRHEGSLERAFEREERAFDRMLASGLLAAHRGRYVAVWKGRVVDADPSAAELVRRVGRRLGARVFFVGYAGAEEPEVDLPGQERS